MKALIIIATALIFTFSQSKADDLLDDITSKEGALFYARALAECASSYRFMGLLNASDTEEYENSIWAGHYRGAMISAKWLMAFTDYQPEYIDSLIESKDTYWTSMIKAVNNSDTPSKPFTTTLKQLETDITKCTKSYGEIQAVLVDVIKLQLYKKEPSE